MALTRFALYVLGAFLSILSNTTAGYLRRLPNARIQFFIMVFYLSADRVASFWRESVLRGGTSAALNC